MNPVRGGSPPRERSAKGARDVKIGNLVHDEAREFIDGVIIVLNIIKAVSVIGI